MSSAISSPSKLAPGHRALMLIGLPLLLGVGVVGSPFAQSAGATSEQHDHAGPPHRRMLGASALERPPAPAIMRDSIQVSGKQLQDYTRLYQSHMAATKQSRDSLRTSMQAARAAFEKGDRSEARTRREAVGRQWKQLAERDKKFEDGLSKVLTTDQESRYQAWKDKRKQEARDRWRHGHGADARREGWTFQRDSTDASRQPFDSGKAPTE